MRLGGFVVVSEIVVEEFVIDDDSIDKFWSHGVEAHRVLEVLNTRHHVARNRRDRRASHIVVGTDASGRCLAIPIEPTSDPLVWRPVTAWPCKPSERRLLR
jgi:hypothetical protein